MPINLPPSLLLSCVVPLLLSFSGRQMQAQDEASAHHRFQPPGMWIWDNWFAHDGENWHAFYLQVPKAIGKERRWKNNDLFKHVGHATAQENRDGHFEWRNEGPSLFALPGTWNDRHIATGSIIHHNNRWWKFFTGRGHDGDGVGLALSDDLMTWTVEPAPQIPLIDTFATTATAPFESEWNGETRRWAGISDPYIYPKSVDGWFYLVLCSRILDVPIEESGCLTLMRSRNLRNWESAGIMAWPRCFERMETPQLLHRPDGNWSLIFGGVVNAEWAMQKENQSAFPEAVRGKGSHKNYVYHLPEGFLRPADDEKLHYIDTPPGHYYIMKIISLKDSPDRRDLAFFTATEPSRGSVLSEPFRVGYLPNGGIKLEPILDKD